MYARHINLLAGNLSDLKRILTTPRVTRNFRSIKFSNLEHMESFKLDVSTFVLEHVHHQFQVFRIANVFCHHSEIVTIQ